MDFVENVVEGGFVLLQGGILAFFWEMNRRLEATYKASIASHKVTVEALEQQKQSELSKKDLELKQKDSEIEDRDRYIDRLRKKIEELDERITDINTMKENSEEDLKRIKEITGRAISRLRAAGIEDEDLLFLGEIGRSVDEGISDIERIEKACSLAAKWLELNSDELILHGYQKAVDKHPDLFPNQEDIENFRQDIENCIKWTVRSLSNGDYLPTEDLFSSFSLKYIFPYKTAINQMIDIRETDGLPLLSDRYLESFMKELSKKINNI